MPITKTSIHAARVAEQVIRNLVGLQNDLRRNAQTWRKMATAQSPPLQTLQQFLIDAAASYRKRLDWLTTYRNDATKRAALDAAFTGMGIVTAEVVSMWQELNTIVAAMEGAQVNTYARIITACDSILANVDAPDSLWPE